MFHSMNQSLTVKFVLGAGFMLFFEDDCRTIRSRRLRTIVTFVPGAAVVSLNCSQTHGFCQQLFCEEYSNIQKYSGQAPTSCWSESIAVGSSASVEALRKQLGPRTKGRDILAVEGAH